MNLLPDRFEKFPIIYIIEVKNSFKKIAYKKLGAPTSFLIKLQLELRV